MNIQMPHIGRFACGELDAITDVGQITVGHTTLDHDDIQTGVTAIIPHSGNLFMQKVPAAAAVINGFGKSVGLVQVQELGVLETPIALTNTFSVPAVSMAQIQHCIAENPECGKELSTVNSLVMECNDGYLNDIQKMAVATQHYEQALKSAERNFARGAVGAGRGMSCCKLKGGIGTASRVVPLANLNTSGQTYHVGALVLANFGQLSRLTVDGQKVGQMLLKQWPSLQQEIVPEGVPTGDKGSIIMVLATDAPVDSRQLKRLAMRAGAGLARTGSYYGHGSGDIALAFSTAYTVPHLVEQNDTLFAMKLLNDAQLDVFFEAACDCVEQSILSALWHAQTLTGRDGHQRVSLVDLLKMYPTS